jgi:hypothetical protein
MNVMQLKSFLITYQHGGHRNLPTSCVRKFFICVNYYRYGDCEILMLELINNIYIIYSAMLRIATTFYVIIPYCNGLP